jgi:PiT family inorganic phosphate transporter
MNIGTTITLLISFYVAWSIGSNDETVAPLSGSGTLSLTKSVALGSIASFLGAVFMGQKVETTIGEGLLKGTITETEVLIILFSVATWLTIASFSGWPVSTTHSSVGAIIGLGVIKWNIQGVHWSTLTLIGFSWIISPFLGFIGAILFHKTIRFVIKKRVKGLIEQIKLARSSAIFLTLSVFLTSFSRGANDIANATAILGDVSGIGPIYIRSFIATGMLLGLFIIGRRVIQSVGVELVELDPISALSTQIAVALIMFIGTYLGFPLSGTHILVGAIVGLGVSKGIWVNLKEVRDITFMWLATFIGAATISIGSYLVYSMV